MGNKKTKGKSKPRSKRRKDLTLDYIESELESAVVTLLNHRTEGKGLISLGRIQALLGLIEHAEEKGHTLIKSVRITLEMEK